MAIVFLDECGYTGPDLLATAQPYLVIATVGLEEQRCAELKQQYFSAVNARELKHVALVRSDAQKQMVVQMMSDDIINQATVKISVCHKRFALTAKIVDYLIEPVLYERGHDLYDNGAHIGMANMLHACLNSVGAANYGQNLLRTYQAFARSGEWRQYELFRIAARATNHTSELRDAFRTVKICSEVLPARRARVPANGLDLSIAAALALMPHWTNDPTQPIELIHDRSTNMSRQKHLWDALVDPDNQPMAEPIFEGRALRYAAISSTSFEASEAFAGLQIADVVAGTINHAIKWGVNDPGEDWYGSEVNRLMVEKKLVVHTLWPTNDVTPEEIKLGKHIGDHTAYTHGLLQDHGAVP